MKLRILFITLMVTLMANFVLGSSEYLWDVNTGNWTDMSTVVIGGTTFDVSAVWKTDDGGGGYGDSWALSYPDGDRPWSIGGTANATINTDVSYSPGCYWSNRASVQNGVTLTIEKGGVLDGVSWIRIGNQDEGARVSTSTDPTRVVQTGGKFILINGKKYNDMSEWDTKDPACLTISDGQKGPLSDGIYSISGGTLTYRENPVKPGDTMPNGNYIVVGDRLGDGTFEVTGKGTDEGKDQILIQMDYLHVGGKSGSYVEAERRADGHLVFNLEHDGVAPIGIAKDVIVHSWASSVTSLTVTLTEALDSPGAEIILVNKQGAGAVQGVFDTFSNGVDWTNSAEEGAIVNIGGGVYRILTYVGGDGNDISLLIPEPATLALLSLGMFIIRRKK